MMIFERDIAIDLGTTNIRVFVRGKGIMLREPSIVAVDKYTGRMLKVGQDAQKMLGRTPANIVAIHPISAGVISDYDMTALMLKELLSRVTSFSLFKPRVLVTVPSSVTGVEERNVIDAVIEAGARKVYLVESAVATAAGAGADISKPDGHLVIDIGGGTTEVAVVSLGGVVESESIKTAGDAFDEAIVRYVPRPARRGRHSGGQGPLPDDWPAEIREDQLRRARGGHRRARARHTRDHPHGA